MEDVQVYQVTKLLFQHGLRVPSTGRILNSANFVPQMEPLFGAAKGNELCRLHEHTQQEPGWKAKVSKAFGWFRSW